MSNQAMDMVKIAGYDILKTSLGVVVANQLKLGDKLDFGDSFLARNASNGGVYFLVSDGVNLVSNGTGASKVLNMDLKGIWDDVVFFGALSAVADVTKSDEMLENLVRKLSADRNTVATLVDASIVSGGRILGSYIDAYSSNSLLHSIRHPSSMWGY
jgi:predicted nucleic acid-binding protein